MKRTLTASIAVVSLLAAACGGAPSTSPAASSAASAALSAPAAASTSAEPSAALSGTITYWTGYDQVGPEFKTLTEVVVPAFEAKHPGVKVEVQGIPDEELRAKIITAVAGGAAPDLLRADVVQVPEFAEQGALLALDTEMPDFQALADSVYPGPLSSNKWGDHYYGLPLDTNTRILFANSAVWQKAGLSALPTTVDEFETALAAIKAAEPDVFGYAEGGTGAWNVLPWIWSFGGSVTDDGVTVATGHLNSAGTVAAVTKLKEWLDKGYLSPSILGGGTPTSEQIGNGQAAMVVEGPWMPPIFSAQFPNLKTEFAPIPAGPGGSASVVGGEDIVVFQQTKNKEAALAFVRFALSEEAQLAMGKTGQMPVITSLAGNSELPAYFSVFAKQLETAKARTPSPQWPKIDEAIGDAVLAALRGDKPVQQALDEAAAIVDPLLK